MRFPFMIGLIAILACGLLIGCSNRSPDKEQASDVGSPKSNGVVQPAGTSEAGKFDGTMKVGHVAGVCMSPLFYAHDQGLFAAEGIKTELVWNASPGDGMNMLDSGELQIVHGPFTNVLRSVDQGAELTIISGSGNGGIFCMAQPELGIKSVDDLKKLVAERDMKLKVGSSRLNTLELTWYGLISEKGMSYDDFEMKFFPDYFSMTAAFENKQIDIITHVEPYATMISDEFGGVRIGSNADVWGPDPPDCVVSVRTDFLKKYPATIKAYLRAILQADGEIKKDMNRAAAILIDGKYYKVTFPELAAALPRQPPGVDLRVAAFEKATKDMLKLEYIKKKPEGIVDVSLLKEVIAERVEGLPVGDTKPSETKQGELQGVK